MLTPVRIRWALGLSLAAALLVGPFILYRSVYTTSKRLRVVTPGKVYRSGQMTAEGLANAITRLGIRTVINLQDEYPDPDVPRSFLCRDTVKESTLCRQLGARYVHIAPDLISRRRLNRERPAAIDRFLTILDDPAAYPVLIHCRAGLHRTGVMVAVYRMEYEGWDWRAAVREVRDNGFGRWACSAANDYIMQYVLSYRPGIRRAEACVAESRGE